MNEHSYNQYCPVAHALDLIGDRWALLIVRDLILGPKRFTDLRGGLPGIGTNILTSRLKQLEQAGVIGRRYLPPPAASTVYELTPYGAELGPSLATLASWGSKTLGPLQAGQVISPSGIMLTVSVFAQTLSAAGLRGTFAIQLQGGAPNAIYMVRISDDGTVAFEGDAQIRPDVTLAVSLETMMRLRSGHESLRSAVDSGTVHLDGDPVLCSRLLDTIL